MRKELENHSHKRYNILTGEWILVSPHRTKRPWQGQEDEISHTQLNTYYKNCYLCPANIRYNGDVNPKYTNTFVFKNDFSALEKDAPNFKINNGLLKAESETGICKVVCFSPDHSKTLADLSVNEIKQVISVWQQEYTKLGKLEDINYIQIFENKGAIMGVSNPHPHGQIWAESSIPNEVQKKDKQQKKYFDEKGVSLLEDYTKQEIELKERIIFENENFVTLVPFWAIWPFETMILPKTAQSNIGLMDDKQITDFANAIKRLTSGYDKLFNCSFPYSSGIHQAPTNTENYEHWHWHMSFYPPLLRSSSIKKFMVGYEMFAMPQRDITAETAAKRLLQTLSK